jgi:hypothetical protein
VTIEVTVEHILHFFCCQGLTIGLMRLSYILTLPPQVDWKEEEDMAGKLSPAVKTLVQEKLEEKLKKCKIFDWRVGQDTPPLRLCKCNHSVEVHGKYVS